MPATVSLHTQRLQQQAAIALFFLAVLAMSLSLAWQASQAIALVNAAPQEAPAPQAPVVPVPTSPYLSYLFGNPAAVAQGQVTPDTDLQLSLLASFVNPQAEQSAALIAALGSKARRVTVGAEISPGVSLQAVHKDHVLLLRDGHEERLQFTRASRPATFVSTAEANHTLADDAAAAAHWQSTPSSFALTGATQTGTSATDTPRTP
ncbi:MAG: type II secretion system protein N [Pseudomonas sp.]|uniref:type II secretion system protein N n=1 Tax=Pseudomonas sp. TaxID=306 RepID=UPI003399032D